MIIREAVKRAQSQRDSLQESLLKDKKRVLYEGKDNRGNKVQYTMGELLEGIRSDRMKADLALMLHNQQEYYRSLDETTRIASVGSYDRWAFPIVRAIFPNLIANDLVSVQPMDGPTSLVFFLKFVYGVTKGRFAAGQDALLNPGTSYASKLIEQEAIGTGDGGTFTFAGFLAWIPVRAGTLVYTDGTQIVTDDGSGTLAGDGTGTINYSTGQYSVTFTAAPAVGLSITADYNYDNEGSTAQGEMDMVLTSRPVTAVCDKLVSKWSVEVATDYKRVHGLDADVELMAAQTSEMKYEIDHKIINHLLQVATNSITTWSGTPLAGVSYTEHKLSFMDTLNHGKNQIYKTTQRAEAEYIVGGIDVMNVIETLPGFKGNGQKIQGRGVRHVGSLNNTYEIYKDSYLDDEVYLMGSKGNEMWNTGYIFSPYEMFRQTPDIMLTDFLVRKGTWCRYGRTVLDGGFFAVGRVSNIP